LLVGSPGSLSFTVILMSHKSIVGMCGSFVTRRSLSRKIAPVSSGRPLSQSLRHGQGRAPVPTANQARAYW
jgi:hypothetical protein